MMKHVANNWQHYLTHNNKKLFNKSNNSYTNRNKAIAKREYTVREQVILRTANTDYNLTKFLWISPTEKLLKAPATLAHKEKKNSWLYAHLLKWLPNKRIQFRSNQTTQKHHEAIPPHYLLLLAPSKKDQNSQRTNSSSRNSERVTQNSPK